MRSCFTLLGVSALLTGFCSCQKAQLEFREVKRLHEKVTETEMKQFLRIVEALPNKELPPLPPVLRPLPNWNSGRTLPVKELVNEERKLLAEGWDVNSIANRWKKYGSLQRAVEREELTLEQFIGLMLSIGAATSRSKVRPDQKLAEFARSGKSEVKSLQNDDRPFAKLSREVRYAVLQRSGGLTRIDRAERLKDVPPENIDLVTRYADKLEKVLPHYFLENPIDAVADRLAEQGMPFEELPSTGRDDEIIWSPEDSPIVPATPGGILGNPGAGAVGFPPADAMP